MLGTATITAFLATTDAARARRFFETTLGLRLKTDDQFALAFDSDGVELRIQKVEKFQPHPFTAPARGSSSWRWNACVAFAVSAPKIPSSRVSRGTNPASGRCLNSSRNCCQSRTSSPLAPCRSVRVAVSS